MATLGKRLGDIETAQIETVADIADKTVHTHKTPVSVEMTISLKEGSDKVASMKKLLSEFDKRDLLGKADIVLSGTKFSSAEIEQITTEMAKYKDKSVNLVFDSEVNNFSREDTMKIMQACDGSKSTRYPFTSTSKDGLSAEERQSFLDKNPNIIEGSNSATNLKKLKELLGVKNSNVRSEVVDNSNARKIPVSAYAESTVATMDETKLREVQKYSAALERLSIDYGVLTLGNLINKGYDEENLFYKTIKTSTESRLQTIENNKSQTQENTQQTTSNNTQTQQSKVESNTATASAFLDPMWEEYNQLLNDPSKNAKDLWEKPQQIFAKYPNEPRDDVDNFLSGTACWVALRDPKFNSQEMLARISNGVRQGFACENTSDEIPMYQLAADAIASIGAANKSDETIGSRARNTLHSITKECLNIDKSFNEGKITGADGLDNQDLASHIMDSYAKIGYDTPSQAKSALDDVAQLSKVNSDKTLDTVYSIVNSGIEGNADVASSAFNALKNVKVSNTEDAFKMLKLYKDISLDNPELAEASVMNMHKIFKQFPNDEKLQKECLSTLQSLNGYRSKFDEDTQKNIDKFSKSMKSHIDAQEIQRARGNPTTWTQPNTTSNNSGPNQSTNDDIKIHKEESLEEMAKRYSGRTEERSKSWEREYSGKSNTKTRQVNIDIDYGYGGR